MALAASRLRQIALHNFGFRVNQSFLFLGMESLDSLYENL